jgi:cytochrome c peroxidase
MKAIYVIIFALILASCHSIEEPTTGLTLDLPLNPADYSVGGNNNVPELGRVLFYDKQLSLNNSVACASCHKQVFGFADNVAFSRGFENVLTVRNSMPIQNLQNDFFTFFDGTRFVSSSILFWDGRESNLNSMVLRPILNHIEMGTFDVQSLAQKLSTVPYYKPLFKKAYGDEAITPTGISVALSAFVASINSNNTKFDRFKRNQEQLSALETNGRRLFFDIYDCNSCHQVETPNGYAVAGGGFADIGLTTQDNGRGGFTKRTSDEGKFKIPSLRNVALTSPYMHDGRFETLDDVLDHYSGGIQNTPNLDFRLRSSNGAKQLNISSEEKKAIIAFLNTLTDYQMITDSKFSSPFKIK